MKKSVYRIILIVAGLLELIGFTVFSLVKGPTLYGLEALYNDLDPITGNGLTLIKKMLAGFQDAKLVFLVAVIPVIIGIVFSIVNLAAKGKASYICSIIFEAIAFVHTCTAVVVMNVKGKPYSCGAGSWIILIATIAALTAAIMGLVKDTSVKDTTIPVGAVKPVTGGKAVKVGKRDGAIVGVSGSYEGAEFPIKNGQVMLLGRDTMNCNIIVRGENISRKHCMVTYNEETNTYNVTDTSSNGIYDALGKRLPASVTFMMKPGDEIQLGNSKEVFRFA